ncbi:DNA glycosylase, partial [Sistotremastrum niveocremeum HHB9708]
STPSSSPQKNKKLKLISDFGTVSPFPDFAHPSPSDAQSIFDLLLSTHPEFKNKLKNTRVTPENSQDVNSAQTCGKVHDVIDSLIGTILSQNTSGKNSSGAKRNLDATFGRHNFKAIAEAPREQLVDALRSGGLANKKAAVIQNVLKEIHERHGKYSLQHLTSLPDEEVMKELQSYAGVGPKTASCVLLFCLGRDSFAVDTHVYRLTRLLGWVPPKADRVMAQAHLDIRVPNHLKYGLHVMLIGHGRRCSGCKGDGSRGACVLKTWLKEKK